MDQTLIKFMVHEIEPGWTCVNFEIPPRLVKARMHSLLQFLETWRSQNPRRRIEMIQPIERNEIVLGLNVFWSDYENAPSQRFKNILIDREIHDRFGQEYAEALIADGLDLSSRYPSITSGVVLISKRKVAVVLVLKVSRCLVTTYEKFLATLDDNIVPKLARDFEDWQMNNSEGFFFAMLPEDYSFRV